MLDRELRVALVPLAADDGTAHETKLAAVAARFTLPSQDEAA